MITSKKFVFEGEDARALLEETKNRLKSGITNINIYTNDQDEITIKSGSVITYVLVLEKFYQMEGERAALTCLFVLEDTLLKVFLCAGGARKSFFTYGASSSLLDEARIVMYDMGFVEIKDKK